MPSRRAAPTSASAASGPGQVTSSADERPGSVSEPWARNAPRQAASASQVAPDTTCGGSPRTGRPRPSSRPVCRASDSPSRTTRTTYRLPRRSPPGASTIDVAGVPEHLGDVPAQPAGRVAGVELGLDHDPPADDVQPAGEPQRGRDLGLAAARLGHLEPAELVLDQRRQSHAGHPAIRSASRGEDRRDRTITRVDGSRASRRRSCTAALHALPCTTALHDCPAPPPCTA